jgi:DNA-binding NarL/FixJ family response regulator
MSSSFASSIGVPGFWPVSPPSVKHFRVLKRRIALALLSSDVDPSLLIVHQSRLVLGLLVDTISAIRLCAACEGYDQALHVLSLHKPGMLLLGDQLSNGCSFDLIDDALRCCPDLRIMQFVQNVEDYRPHPRCHAVIADADLGFRHDYPVHQGFMAMLANTRYVSPALSASELVDVDGLSVDSMIELTPREKEILDCYAKGFTNQEAADQLGLQVGTVKTYSSRLLMKLGVRNRQKALRKALSIGLTKLIA